MEGEESISSRELSDLETVKISAEVLYMVLTLGLLGVFAHSARALYKFRKIRMSTEYLDEDGYSTPLKGSKASPEEASSFVIATFVLLGLSLGISKFKNV